MWHSVGKRIREDCDNHPVLLVSSKATWSWTLGTILICQLVQREALSAEGIGGTASLLDLPVPVMASMETRWHSLSSRFHPHPRGWLPADQS